MRSASERAWAALGWRAIGFSIALGALVLVAGLWGPEIAGRIDRAIYHPEPKPPPRAVRGGDASQPAPVAGQLPEPVPAGDTGGTKPPKGGSDAVPAPRDPGSDPPVAPPPPGSNGEQSQPAPAPVVNEAAPSGLPPAPAPPSPVPVPPGLLTPALTTVCPAVDRLAHLC